MIAVLVFVYIAARVFNLNTLQWVLSGLPVAIPIALLVIFQAMDAAGKDGTIKHVMSGVNPQGVTVDSFKIPSAEELDHDFLWRCTRCLPERGRIGIWNRSHYEETLVVRVHPEFLEKQRLPPDLVTALAKQQISEPTPVQVAALPVDPVLPGTGTVTSVPATPVEPVSPQRAEWLVGRLKEVGIV